MTPDTARRLRRLAWLLFAVAAIPMGMALWIRFAHPEAPGAQTRMVQWLLAGVGLYMVGRFLLIRLRWTEKKRPKED